MKINEREHLPVVCVDLDGVLNEFDTWMGSEYFHPVRPGAPQFLRGLNEAGFRVVVFTVRYGQWVEKWLEENGLSRYVDQVTDRKPPAHVYLDDRAVCFRGDFEAALKQIVHFKPHWEASLPTPAPGAVPSLPDSIRS